MKTDITIWHNKVCSTSRKALDLIQSQTENLEIRDYIKNPPSVAEIKNVLKMMGQEPSYILRKKDKVFQALFADKTMSDEQWIVAMSQHPSIIERPIVVIGKKAYLARPFDEFAHQLEQLMED
jgi:arsenate reductase (glutaredoxin)